ncbi:MAG: beta-propeller domain-containing protein [Candidatus Woesearchaeota archaeon]
MENRNLMIIAFLFGILFLAGCQQLTVPGQPAETKLSSIELVSFDPSKEIEASTFGSINELKAFLGSAGEGAGYGGAMRNSLMTLSDSAVAKGAAMEESVQMPSAVQADGGDLDFSGTNVQVQGVDEGDILKTDGNYIYTITDSTLFIVKAYPGEEAQVVSTVKFDKMSPMGLFISGDKMVVFGNIYDLSMFKDMPVKPRSGMAFFKIYDISDKAKPTEVKDYKFEGNYFESRMSKGYVYFVVNSYPDEGRDNPIPLAYDGIAKLEMPIGGVHYFPIPYDSTMYTSIHAINIDTQSVNSQTLVVESSQNMYMSDSNIFITYTKYINEWQFNQEITMEMVMPLLSDSDKALIARIDATDSDILSKSEKKGKIMNIVYSHINYMGEDERKALNEMIDKRVAEKMKEYEASEYTVIHKVSILDGNVEVKASGKVPGHIMNQFSLDENGGILRIATTVGSRWWGPWRGMVEPMAAEVVADVAEATVAVEGVSASSDVAVAKMIAPMPQRQEQSNNIYTLDADLKVIDSLTGLAEGEQIYSTRFIGDRLYMVTFRQVDPFFVIDLSNPADIKQLGELKIPGFSRYLHPYDDNTIIGIGRDATETGRSQGLKISLFDVTDVANPKEIAKYVSDDEYAQSNAEYEHKAFLFSKDKSLLVIPMYNYNYEDKGKSYNGAMVFDITKDSIKVKGLVDHSKASQSQWYSPSVERSLYIEDLLYTKSPSLLRINKLDDLSSVKDVDLKVDFKGEIPVF